MRPGCNLELGLDYKLKILSFFNSYNSFLDEILYQGFILNSSDRKLTTSGERCAHLYLAVKLEYSMR